MAGDLTTFGNYFPQAGDNVHQTLQRLLAKAVRPAEDAVIYLAEAARLGNTVGGVIDTRGFKGIMINVYVTAVAAAGTIRCSLYGNTNILMSTTATRLAETGFGTTSFGILCYPGITTPISTAYSVQGVPLGRYAQIAVLNSSAVAGNEVTFEVSYMLLD